MAKNVRRLYLVLGDQLDEHADFFDEFDPDRDMVWMAEVVEESTHVWSHQHRIALFLSAMRHYRERCKALGRPIEYSELEDNTKRVSFADVLTASLKKHKPQEVLVQQPGDYRVLESLRAACASSGYTLEVRPESHFYDTLERFREHAAGRKQLRLEFYYRELRKRHDILMDGGKPVGGAWNFDKENRKAFSKKGPGLIVPPPSFDPDAITKHVLDTVAKRFSEHPGNLDNFDWPVTPEQAQAALDDFIRNRLPQFGTYQDAMWQDEPFLNHSLLASALNLKLINPRTVVNAAVAAYEEKHAPLNAVEGFVRQILGWREYVRGIYWINMPAYVESNALEATASLPSFYWDGDIEMKCLSQAIGQTLEHGYAHHIHRLMVTGLFALLLGVRPKEVHEWYLAMYVDAVAWVEIPNTIGMSQYADGGLMASKPYVATGKYIQRMSNYCNDCPYIPAEAVGENACPFTTLYWDFLDRNQPSLSSNQRMGLQLRNLDRLDASRIQAIRKQAKSIRKRFSK
ncbi:MAG: cryptochrome/photolyase family protein [Candidatus Eisenbacteria bacterium]|uniref:Cryptochrome/photolyase family protein n=1 Tax=Eiseniibacteriota bacterium TaxID=2212470 RepID=A0A7Y2EAC4_UNCEI|nr:cryptochrome/photolyase family protein [Candidatus Eisenbacteria bacterium]